jgi:hypothetical protein
VSTSELIALVAFSSATERKASSLISAVRSGPSASMWSGMAASGV